MAKLAAPLFSFTARGAIGQALVYFPWKGLNCVRQYIIPANPQSTLQTAQRARLTAAVAEFHAALYTAGDLSAWTRYAATLAKVMTGFNAMCRAYVNENILGNTWERMRNAYTDGVLTTQFNVMVTKGAGGNTPTIHWGTRATFFPNSEAMADQGGDVWAITIDGLSLNTDYYFWIEVGSSGADYARTGVYLQRTAAS